MTAGPIGLIVNPASGKDIRRLVAHASVFDNAEKASIVRRAILGAVAAGATDFLYMPDDHGLVERALDGIGTEVRCRPVEVPGTASALDTTRAAERMHEAGCVLLITLGGDGTNRAVALGWRNAPLIPLSTGTNNVFPQFIEATVAGAAAGLIAGDSIKRDLVSSTAKCVEVEIDGEHADLALIDAALLDGAFTGTRALWDATALRAIVLSRGEPATVGLSTIGGLLDPTSDADDRGLYIELAEGDCGLQAPIAPGLYQHIGIRSLRRLALAEPVSVRGPGVLALDGERERRLRAGQQARLRVVRDGPRVIDVRATLTEAARRQLFRRSGRRHS